MEEMPDNYLTENYIMEVAIIFNPIGFVEVAVLLVVAWFAFKAVVRFVVKKSAK
jgi:hypothetical protein